MYLNLHILFTLAAANPNRDDAGSPKTIVYGDATRSRISSQAMTRPKRRAFEADLPGEATKRSVFIASRITELAEKLIAEAGDTIDARDIERFNKAAAKTIISLTAKSDKAGGKSAKKVADATVEAADADSDGADDAEGDGNSSEAKATLVWLAESEILAAARKLVTDFAAAHDLDLAPEDFLIPGRTDSLAIASFGRMFAQRPDLSTEAAIQRAHAFTTHATVNEVDYFTTVDDLRITDKGAGHLGIAELTGGVYYWHANLDVRQLLRTWTAADADDARDRLTALFEALFLALPTGKQNTTAHHTIPAVVLAVPAKLPASLQAAFETPARPADRNGGFLAPSIRTLFDEHARTVAALPSRFSTARFAGTAEVPTDAAATAQQAGSLDELAAWCADQVLAARQVTR